MSAITPEQKSALTTAISGLVTRLQSSQLSEAQVNTLIAAYVSGIIADDPTASAGTSTTELASIRGAYLAAKKALEDELAGNPVGLQTLADIGAAVAANRTDIDSVTATLAGLANAFNYVGTVSGGADSGTAFDLDTLPAGGKDAGDYYKVASGGWFVVVAGVGTPFQANTNDGLVWNTSGGIDIIDNTNSTVGGTTDEIDVSGSVDTGFVVALSQTIRDRLAALEANTTGEDIEVRARLDVSGTATAVPVADVLTTLRADARNIPLGTHVHTTTATVAGLGAETDAEVTIHSHVVQVATGEVVINQTATWNGKSATRSADTRDEDTGAVTALQWTSWAVPMDEIDSLYTLLTTEFNNAAT